MIKHGKVVVGQTPSVESGKPSQVIKEGEPVRKREQPETARGLNKLASALESDFSNEVNYTIPKD